MTDDDLARAQAVADQDPEAAWAAMTPDEQSAVLARLRRRVEASRAALRDGGTQKTGVPGKSRRRAKAKAARAARKRNRR